MSGWTSTGAGGTGPGFHQSTTPYGGLTAPPVARRGPLDLVSRTFSVPAGQTRSQRLLALLARRRGRRDGPREGTKTPMSKLQKYADLVAAVRQSVIECASAAPEDLETELSKRFEGFEAALGQELENDLPPAADELDHVSLLSDRLEEVRAVVEEIGAGACLKVADAGPSEEAMELAQHWLALGDIMVRAMATEQAQPFEKGEALAEGEQLFKIEAEDGDILLKTALPEDLAELIVPPHALSEELVAFGADLLAFAGVGPEDLAKSAGDDEDGEDDEGGEDEGDGDEGDGDEGGDAPPFAGGDEGDEEEGDEGEEGPDAPPAEGGQGAIEAIVDLGSMILVQVDAIKREMEAAGLGHNGGPAMDGAEGGEGLEGEAAPLSAIDAIGQHAALIVAQADAIQGVISGAEGGGDDGEDLEESDEEGAAGESDGSEAGAEGDAGNDEAPSGGEAGEGSEGGAEAGDEEEKEKVVGKSADHGAEQELRKQATDAAAAAEAAQRRAAEAEAKLAELQAAREEELEKRAREPAPGKAVLAGGALSKAADMTVNEGGAKPFDLEAEAQRLSKMSENDRAAALVKLAHRSGGVAYDPTKI